MGARDRIDEQEREQSLSELSTSLSAIDEQLGALTSTVQQVVESQNRNTATVRELSTSLELEASSSKSSSDPVLSAIGEVAKTLELMAETLTSSQVVKLPDGASVTRSDLSAHVMATKVANEMTDLRSTTERLASEVHAKTHVKVDAAKVAQVVTARLGVQIDKLVEASTERVSQVLAVHEERLEALGRSREAQVASRLQEATESLEKAERMAEGLRRSLTWAGVGKVAMASIPFALAALAIAMLLGLGGQLLGIGPVFGWAWASFAAAEVWWVKLIIAVSTIAGALAVLWVIRWIGGKLYETYRGW